MLLRQHHVRPELVRRAPDPRTLEAPARVVAGTVRYDDLLGARLVREPDDGSDDLGVGVRGVDRHPVPTDVRLDDDDVTARHELANAAHGVDGSPHELLGRCRRVRRIVARFLRGGARNGELRVLRVAFDDTVVAHLARTARLHDVESTLVPERARAGGGGAEHGHHRATAHDRLSA